MHAPDLHRILSTAFSILHLQRVPALCGFWDLEKTELHEIRVSGTVGTVPIAEILSVKNARAWVSMVSYSKKIKN